MFIRNVLLKYTLHVHSFTYLLSVAAFVLQQLRLRAGDTGSMEPEEGMVYYSPFTQIADLCTMEMHAYVHQKCPNMFMVALFKIHPQKTANYSNVY